MYKNLTQEIQEKKRSKRNKIVAVYILDHTYKILCHHDQVSEKVTNIKACKFCLTMLIVITGCKSNVAGTLGLDVNFMP